MKNQKFLWVLLLIPALALSQLFMSNSPTEEAKVLSDFHEHYKIFSLTLPEEIDFAGEPVPMHDFEVAERLDRELLVNTYWQSATLLALKKTSRFFPTIEVILKEQGVPDDFKYLALAESGLANLVSPAGAAGYWQFLKSTGIQYGLEINGEVDERYNLEKATVAACKYLKDAYKTFNNWTLVAAAYNMGSGNLKKNLKRQMVDSYYDLYLNMETSRYLFRILALKEICESPKGYGFHSSPMHLYQPVSTKTIRVDTAVASWAAFAKEKGTTYKMLKTLNPWIRARSLSNKSRKSYEVRLPKETQNESSLDSEPKTDSDTTE